MNARALYAEFSGRGRRLGRVLVLDERGVLDLVARAKGAGLAIAVIAVVRSDAEAMEFRAHKRILGDDERSTSWSDATAFVDMLTGRGLDFAVVIESPWSTRLARIRSMARRIVPDQTSTRMP